MKTNPSRAKSGTRDEVEGTARNIGGKIKEGVGRATGNPRLEAEGGADQVGGQVQKKVGQIKQAFGR